MSGVSSVAALAMSGHVSRVRRGECSATTEFLHLRAVDSRRVCLVPDNEYMRVDYRLSSEPNNLTHLDATAQSLFPERVSSTRNVCSNSQLNEAM
jgi:hypothetical protein